MSLSIEEYLVGKSYYSKRFTNYIREYVEGTTQFNEYSSRDSESIFRFVNTDKESGDFSKCTINLILILDYVKNNRDLNKELLKELINLFPEYMI